MKKRQNPTRDKTVSARKRTRLRKAKMLIELLSESEADFRRKRFRPAQDVIRDLRRDFDL